MQVFKVFMHEYPEAQVCQTGAELEDAAEEEAGGWEDATEEAGRDEEAGAEEAPEGQ